MEKFNIKGRDLQAGVWYENPHEFIIHIEGHDKSGAIIGAFKHIRSSEMSYFKHNTSPGDVHRVATPEDHARYNTGFGIRVEDEDYEIF